MASGTTDKWLEVMDGTPVGPAGAAINDNFAAIADACAPGTSTTRAPTATDDAAHSCYQWAHWYDSSASKLYVCVVDTAAAAVWKEVAAAGGLSDVVADTTPQLGGQLDVQTYAIVSTSNRDIYVTPNGSGQIVLKGMKWPASSGTSGQFLQTDGSGNCSWQSVATTFDVVADVTPQLGGNLDVNGFWITSVSNGSIVITPNGTGSLVFKGQSWPSSGTTNAYLKYSSSSAMTWSELDISHDSSPTLGADLDVGGHAITSTSNGNVAIMPDGSGRVVLSALTSIGGIVWPTTAGTEGYALMLDSVGQLGWGELVGIASIEDDTSPALGGDLDVGGHKIKSTSGGDITVEPDTGGKIYLTAPLVYVSGEVCFPNGGAIQAGNGDLTLAAGGTGSLLFLGLNRFPQEHPETEGYALRGHTTGLLYFAAAMSDIAEDLSPQLGGDLDVNGFGLVSASNGDIPITPNGTGSILLGGQAWPASGSTNNYLVYSTSAAAIWAALDISHDASPTLGGDLDVGSYGLVSTSNGDIPITPNGTGQIIFGGDIDASGRTFRTTANGNMSFAPDGTGLLILPSLTTIGSISWPASDGTTGQYLLTNGAGALSWGTPTPRSVSITIPKGASWDNQTIPIWQIPAGQAVTITQVNATVIGSDMPSLVFNLDERAYGSLNSAGTDVFGSGQTADADGLEATSFDNAGMAAKSHLVFKTGSSASSGTVSALVLLISYTLA